MSKVRAAGALIWVITEPPGEIGGFCSLPCQLAVSSGALNSLLSVGTVLIIGNKLQRLISGEIIMASIVNDPGGKRRVQFIAAELKNFGVPSGSFLSGKC